MTKISAAAAAAREAARNQATGRFGSQSHTPQEGHDLPGTSESVVTVNRYGDREWRTPDGQLHRTDGPAVEWGDGTRVWWVNGERHREDGPAVEGADGTTEWWIHGRQVPAPGEPESVMRVTVDDAREWRDLEDDLHRTDGPAIEWADGSREWWVHGQRHREDGPAIERADGYRVWYQHGLRHREDGPAVERANGTREWWVNGERHRDDGPAVEYTSGTREWWVNGELHRTDGPAVEYPDGTCEWWVHGRRHRAPRT